jgi:integrase
VRDAPKARGQPLAHVQESLRDRAEASAAKGMSQPPGDGSTSGRCNGATRKPITRQILAQSAPQKRGRERWIRLELALVLAEGTGARIGNIRGLKWSDISYSPPQVIWRAEFDKRGRERKVPLPATLVEEIKTLQTHLEGIGRTWLFPTKSGEKPWPRELFDQLLRRAEREAELEHLKGRLWHPFRRKWATERKHLPIPDVKAAGGVERHQHAADLLSAHVRGVDARRNGVAREADE